MADKSPIFTNGVHALSRIFGVGTVDVDIRSDKEKSLVIINAKKLRQPKDDLLAVLNSYMKKETGKNVVFIPTYVNNADGQIGMLANNLFDEKIVLALRNLNIEHLEHQVSRLTPSSSKIGNGDNESGMTPAQIRLLLEQENILLSPTVEEFLRQQEQVPKTPSIPSKPLDSNLALEILKHATGVEWKAQEIQKSGKYIYYTHDGFSTSDACEHASRVLLNMLGMEGYPPAPKLLPDQSVPNRITIMSGWIKDQNVGALFENKDLLKQTYAELAQLKRGR